MAIQQFIDGGFYGKLGDVVGQRWKNIKTLRSWSKPHDPKTPEQIARRKVFGGSVPYAQVAMATNYNSTLFNHNSITKWNYRVSSATKAKDAGLSGLNLVPLTPFGFASTFFIQSFKFSSLSPGGELTAKVTGTLPNVDRQLMLICTPSDGVLNPHDIELYPAAFNHGENPTITVPAPFGNYVSVGKKVRIVSIDDETPNTDNMCCEELTVQSGVLPVEAFDTNIKSAAINGAYLHIIFEQGYFGNVGTVELVSIGAVVLGEQTTISASNLAVTGDNGFACIDVPLSFTDDWNKPAFPSGSALSITNISVESSMVRYTSASASGTFTAGTLVREKSINWANDPTFNGYQKFTAQISEPIAGTYTGNQNLRSWFHEWALAGDTKNASVTIGSDGNAVMQFTAGVYDTVGTPFLIDQLLQPIQMTKNGITYKLNPAASPIKGKNTNTDFAEIMFSPAYIVSTGTGQNKRWFICIRFSNVQIAGASIKSILASPYLQFKLNGGNLNGTMVNWQNPAWNNFPASGNYFYAVCSAEIVEARGMDSGFCNSISITNGDDWDWIETEITWQKDDVECTQVLYLEGGQDATFVSLD